MMQPVWVWLLAVTAYLLSRLAEYRIHRANYRQLSRAGAEELIPKTMQNYYRLTLLCIPLSLIEYVLFSAPVFWEMLILGLLLLSMGLTLRFWAIQTLGPFWSMRCLFIAGAPRVGKGPYRFLKNPEYVSRVMDGVGIGLLLGARWAIAAYLLLICYHSYKIALVERRQLRELTFQARSSQASY